MKKEEIKENLKKLPVSVTIEMTALALSPQRDELRNLMLDFYAEEIQPLISRMEEAMENYKKSME